ncbi:MAG: hypothetical protein MJ193_04635 [Clostridia bacterium]|nr:hypothetical protein [Clostridia bacterium]
MKNKILLGIIAICLIIPCMFLFVACGENEEDETPHALAVKAVLVEDGNAQDMQVEGLQGAGSYCLQDRVNLYAPSIPKYRFVSWYTDGGQFISVQQDLTGEAHGWWNMEYDRDGYVEARYEYLRYQVTYVGLEGVIQNPINPTYYDGKIAEDDITLEPEIIEYYDFKYWFYYGEGGVEIPCATLPTTTDGDVVAPIAEDVYALTLFAHYDKIQYNVNVNFIDDAGDPLDITPTIEGFTYSQDLEFEGNTAKVDCDWGYIDITLSELGEYQAVEWEINGTSVYGGRDTCRMQRDEVGLVGYKGDLTITVKLIIR